jgi:uncharacterized protein YndB with AHSA1/START domain
MPNPVQAQSVLHSTFVLERSYHVSPEEVYSAFSDPAKKRRWYAQAKSHDVEEYSMDFRVGGTDRGRYRFTENSPFPGVILTNVSHYLDIVPNRRIVFAYCMTMHDHRFSASLSTVDLVPTSTGTDLIFTEQGAFFENSDGPEMRKDGWSKLLDSLGRELKS